LRITGAKITEIPLSISVQIPLLRIGQSRAVVLADPIPVFIPSRDLRAGVTEITHPILIAVKLSGIGPLRAVVLRVTVLISIGVIERI